jgi:oligo-1,6-glucosidase
MLALLNAALTGTLYLYQGQEIGQVNCPHDWELEDYIDVDAVNWVREVKLHHPGDHQALEKARFGIRTSSRRLRVAADGKGR